MAHRKRLTLADGLGFLFRPGDTVTYRGRCVISNTESSVCRAAADEDGHINLSREAPG